MSTQNNWDPFAPSLSESAEVAPEVPITINATYPSADPLINADAAIYTGQAEITRQAAILPTANDDGQLLPASYPSAEPVSTATAALPVVIPQQTKRRAPGKAVRRSISQFMRADQALTAPLRGVARVAQKQFTLRAQRREESFVREKEQAREVLNFTVRLAETMFHYGADAIDVDSAIVSVCSTYGLNQVEISITNQSIIINYVSDIDRGVYSPVGGTEEDLRFSHTVVRVVRTLSENYAALNDIYRLIHEITESNLPMKQAAARLTSINETPKLYSPLWVLLFNLLIAGSFTLGVGGSWRGAVVSIVSFTVIHFLGQWLAKFGLPGFFMMIFNAAVLATIALYISDDTSIFYQLGFEVSAPHIVGAGLMLFMPTFFLVSCVQDALHGFPLTAAGKLVSTAISFLGLAIGIATAVEILTYAGASGIDLQKAVFTPPPLWVSIVGMAVGSMACAGVTQARKTNLALIIVVSLVGQAVYYGFSTATGLEVTRVNAVLAACTVGGLSTYLAYKLYAPQVIFSVCGIMFLLPGLTFFRGLYAFSVHNNESYGADGMINAGSTVLALAGGVVLGGYLMENAIARWGSSARAQRKNFNR
ncbi:threonine/serine exporter ThrE family protein [Rothia sp. ZJ932]|uniref:threonine/serine ThrE exporter family protein n=1 Tax=Rothia sp. ZJ932 TaxID=2810516 RepID=UPI001968747C|nr:threonine/serine exporter family protein [Rothia sp. ZJ932]QRZ61900.1 threonine/serine exporter family protein [Rothia sp. ZJ932]